MFTYNHLINSNINRLALDICNNLLNHNTRPVFLCVGSSKVIGDSLGPLTGELLIKNKLPAYVYGKLDENITASNLEDYYKKIKAVHFNNPIYIIDASVGALSEIGLVKYKKGSLIPAIYTKEMSSAIGDYSIWACVNCKGINNLMFLNSVKLSLIYNMASFISNAIITGLAYYDKITKPNSLNYKSC